MKYIARIKRIIGAIIFYVLNCIWIVRYPMKENKVCFLSDVRTVMGGNLKSVYDYLEGKDYERVIEFKSDHRIRRNMKQKFQLIYNLATSKYILLEDCSQAISQMKVRKGQEIVQLWHGPGAYKKFGWSRVKDGEKIHVSRSYKKQTKALVSGAGIEWCYAEAFGISQDKIKATGFPRTDEFFDQEYIEKTREKFYSQYPDLKEKKIILFAPTWRGRSVRVAEYDFSQLDLQKMYDELHEDYVFMFKWHPALHTNIDMGIIQAPDFGQYKDFYIDFSSYRDINDLLLICDCLVTDYSSVIFDYVLLNKPIVYFTYDLGENSTYGVRGMYFDFEDYVYGNVAMNQDELIQMIRKNDLMLEKRKVFYDKFMGACDGHATERTCQWIFGEEQ